ncbi:hypothetical protein [Paenibacillus hamazuiensis]|uniref:hypothetical protein n=1 Tax=Paenibacillus hamazuiensis TaxID=2936508 RepID=UPI00200D548C|nr:hypothetical protein [Paenibacillus hamazuiensis]
MNGGSVLLAIHAVFAAWFMPGLLRKRQFRDCAVFAALLGYSAYMVMSEPWGLPRLSLLDLFHRLFTPPGEKLVEWLGGPPA